MTILESDSFATSNVQNSFVESQVGQSRDISIQALGPIVIVFIMADYANLYVDVNGMEQQIPSPDNTYWVSDRQEYRRVWQNMQNVIPNVELRVVVLRNTTPVPFPNKLMPDPQRTTLSDLPDLEIFPSSFRVPPVEEFIALLTTGRALIERPFFVTIVNTANFGRDAEEITNRINEVVMQLETVNGWGPFNRGSPTLFRLAQGNAGRWLHWINPFIDLATRDWASINPA